jgi:hypothetical protein
MHAGWQGVFLLRIMYPLLLHDLSPHPDVGSFLTEPLPFLVENYGFSIILSGGLARPGVKGVFPLQKMGLLICESSPFLIHDVPHLATR